MSFAILHVDFIVNFFWCKLLYSHLIRMIIKALQFVFGQFGTKNDNYNANYISIHSNNISYSNNIPTIFSVSFSLYLWCKFLISLGMIIKPLQIQFTIVLCVNSLQGFVSLIMSRSDATLANNSITTVALRYKTILDFQPQILHGWQ